MTDTTTKPHKARIFSKIVVLVLLAQVLLMVLAGLITYPTGAHRDSARQIDEVTRGLWGMGDPNAPPKDFVAVLESDEYKQLENSPENTYVNAASLSFAIVNMIANIAIIGAVYHYLRRHRLAKKLIGTTVLLVALGTILPQIFGAFGMALYIGLPTPGVGHVAFMLFISIVIAPLVIALVARIFEWFYNRKHSFAVE